MTPPGVSPRIPGSGDPQVVLGPPVTAQNGQFGHLTGALDPYLGVLDPPWRVLQSLGTWQVVLGPPEDGLRTILTIPRDGPDTQIWVSEGDPRVTHLTPKGSETWPDSGQVWPDSGQILPDSDQILARISPDSNHQNL